MGLRPPTVRVSDLEPGTPLRVRRRRPRGATWEFGVLLTADKDALYLRSGRGRSTEVIRIPAAEIVGVHRLGPTATRRRLLPRPLHRLVTAGALAVAAFFLTAMLAYGLGGDGAWVGVLPFLTGAVFFVLALASPPLE